MVVDRRSKVNFMLADFVVRVKSGKILKVKGVFVCITRLHLLIVKFFLRIGLISSFKLVLDKIYINLRFNSLNDYLIKDIKLISKPSRRVYWNLLQIKRFIESSSAVIMVISTVKGLLTPTECLWYRVGGEPLLKIFI